MNLSIILDAIYLFLVFLRNKSTKNHSKEIVKSEYADMFSYNMTQSNKYPLDTLRQKKNV